MLAEPFYIKKLKTELSERIDRNPRYSVRAFAQMLGIESSALSQILRGKRAISIRVANRIFGKLNFSPEEKAEFLTSLGQTKRAGGLKRISPLLRQALGPENDPEKPRDLTGDVFRLISDWYNYAIFELTRVEGFESHPKWIASELGITETEAQLAIDRMRELELLEVVDGKLRKTTGSLATVDRSVTSAAHRRRQKQILLKSMESLENDPIEIRNHSGITMAIDPDRISEAKDKIQKFQSEMARFLVKGRRRRVYELSVGLFPLSKTKNPSQAGHGNRKKEVKS